MNDPIAEAAAQQQPANEPSLLEKAQETIHQLEEKLEHMIHPVEDAAPSSTEPAGNSDAPAAAAPTGADTTAAVEESASSDLPAATDATVQSEPASASQSAASTTTAESESTTATAGAESPNAALTQSAGDATAVGGKAENAGTPAAEPTVATTLEADASAEVTHVVGAAINASDAIRTHLQTIRSHLTLMGFEQSSVKVIHGAMDEIEKLL